MKRRISIFAPSLRGGGAERVVVQISNHLAQKGASVSLVLASAVGEYLSEISPNVNVIDLGVGRVGKSIRPLIRYLKTQQIDSIFSVLSHANAAIAIAHWASGSKARLVVSERNSLITGSSTTPQLSPASKLQRKFTYKRANAITTVSNALRDQILTSFNVSHNKIQAIYNPVNTRQITKLAQEPVSHPWLMNQDLKVVVSAGRLTEQKDYPTLLKAFKLVPDGNARLIILGQGELESQLKALAAQLGIQEKVDFVGFQQNPFKWFRAADLYVLSSRWEGMPNTLLQAIASGVDVISTDCPTGPKEVISATGVGSLVPVGSADELGREIAVKLSSAPSNSPLKPDFSAFSLETVMHQYEEIILGELMD